MGTCIYCGQSAGIFRRKHEECAAKHDGGWTEMISLASQAALGKAALDTLETKLMEIARDNFIPNYQVRTALISGWERAVDHFLDDGNLSPDEETKLTIFQDRFSLAQAELDQRGAYSKIIKAAMLQDLMNGKIPQRVRVENELPFNFQKAEQLIWVFTSVPYYEDKTRRHYVGASHGVSFRIAKGLYYRVGAFRGHPVETTERVHVDTGTLAVTNKHIYFAGASKSLRIRHNKIVSFIPFEDGIGIQQDAATAKPQIFVTGDGWFTHNLLANVSQI